MSEDDYSSRRTAVDDGLDASSPAGDAAGDDALFAPAAAAAVLAGATGVPVDLGDVDFPSEMARTRSIPLAGAGAPGGTAVHRSLPTDAASAGDAEFHLRPAYKSFGAGPTAVLPQHSSALTREHPALRKAAPTASLNAEPLQQASPATVPSTPPALKPSPFFLMPNHFDVPACNTAELLGDMEQVFTDASVAFTRVPEKCKFRCTYHSDAGHSSFRVKVYARQASGPYVVELHCRSGSSMLCNQVYRSMMGALAKSRTVTDRNGKEVKPASGRPKPPMSRFVPRSVPAELLRAAPAPTATDLQPLCEMLCSEYDEVAQDAARTVASLCTGVASNAVVTSEEVTKALVSVLAHANRSSEARSPAAIALDAITKNPSGRQAVVGADGVAALLSHVRLDATASEDAASKTWHLRHSCVNALVNLCSCSEPSVRAAVKSTPELSSILRSIPAGSDADLHAAAGRALQSLQTV